MDPQMNDFLLRHPECEAPTQEELERVTETLNENGKVVQKLLEHYTSLIMDEDDDELDEFEFELQGVI